MNYRFARTALLTLIATFLLSTFSAGQQTRRNLGAVFEKLRAGKPVTIAYLGGSTSAGAGASDAAKTSCRALVTEWLRQRYPQAQITELNAAVGGTGSVYGSIRVRRDVIAHKPDLVFIELASDDARDAEEAVKKSLEGIIRQFLSVPQPPEIVLVYATSAARNARVAWHEAIAQYYGLPAINLQDRIWALIDAGQLTPAVFGKAGTHPANEAHKLYAETITAFLAEQENLKPSPPIRMLAPPWLSDEMTYGELKPVAELKHGPEWRTEQIRDRTLPAALLVSDKTGAQIETIFDGTAVGLTYRTGPDGGMIECLIDGRPAPAPLAKIDLYSRTPHLRTQIIPGGLPPGEHKLTIRVIGEKNAKSSGQHVRLGYLLVGGQRPDRL
jgi:acyl-CoA thioesterase-1